MEGNLCFSSINPPVHAQKRPQRYLRLSATGYTRRKPPTNTILPSPHRLLTFAKNWITHGKNQVRGRTRHQSYVNAATFGSLEKQRSESAGISGHYGGFQNTFFLLAAQVPARRLFHSGFVGFCAGGASDHTLRGCLSGACIRAHPLF